MRVPLFSFQPRFDTPESSQGEAERAMSRASTSQGMNRPASAQGRPASSLSGSVYSTLPKTPKVSASRFGGLSEKEVQKITSTIASARKSTNSRSVRRLEAEHESYRVVSAPAGSFLAEASFINAPLSSRLPPTSPRRATLRTTTSSSSSHQQQTDTEAVSNARIARAFAKENVVTEEAHEEDSASEEEEESVQIQKQRRVREGMDREPLSGLSTEIQEALIVEDLLFVLMGIEGQYIEFDPDYTPEDETDRLQGARFVIDPDLDLSLASVVARVIPLATYYTSINAYVEHYTVYDMGVINHALGAAIREMLREYLVLLAQLEHQFNSSSTFTLQRLWFYLHPTLHTLSLIYALTSEIVALSTPTFDESNSDSSNSSDDGADEGLKAILREMRGGGKAKWEGGVAKGGEILSIISDRMDRTSGDPIALSLYSTLLLKASQPYAVILLGWISTGHLADPFEEFIVKESKSITRGTLENDYTDDYWEGRYTLRDSGAKKSDGGVKEGPRSKGLAGGAVIPKFLEGWKVKILLAGKYLNVIRECGIEIEMPGGQRSGGNEEELVALNEEGFYKRIDEAYTYANKTLLKLLFEGENLVARLRSLKQYFFIDHGDSFSHFLDLAAYELSKKARHVSVSKLQSLLDLALRNPGSASSVDPYTDDLKTVMGKSTLTDWLVKVNSVTGVISSEADGDALGAGLLEAGKKDEVPPQEGENKSTLTGFEALTLDYTAQFPLSLVISRKTILRYQLLFRHLLQLKHLSNGLGATWLEHHKSPVWRNKTAHPELDKWKSRVFALRARMFLFVQQMYSFAVSEVLEPNWRKLEKVLEKVQTVDELLRDHVDFLDTCLKECLLTNEKLLIVHDKLLTTCALFVSYTSHFTRYTSQILLATEKAGGDWTKVNMDKQWDFLDRFERNFNHHSQLNLERISFHAGRENAAVLPLVVRLSYLKIGSRE